MNGSLIQLRLVIALLVTLVGAMLAQTGEIAPRDASRRSAVASQPDIKPSKTIIHAADGLSIVCESRGTGATALLFLHGWCGDRLWWKGQVNAFAQDYRVVAIDQAGHGESGKVRTQWTVEGLAADVQSVVQQLGLKRVILVGHSMGGTVALAAAGRLTGTVVAVIGVDTLQNAEYIEPQDEVEGFLRGFENDFKGTVRPVLRAALPGRADRGLLEWIGARAERQDPRVAVALMRDLNHVDTKRLFQNARVPIRCINAAPGSTQFAKPTETAVNKRYADFEAIIMEGVGHFPMLEQPPEFNRRLREVLRELARR